MPSCGQLSQLRVEDAAELFEVLTVAAGLVQNMKGLFARIEKHLVCGASVVEFAVRVTQGQHRHLVWRGCVAV